MVCQTMKQGTECFLMTKQGCGFNGGSCYAVVEKCEGCDRVKEYPTGKFCSSYPHPEIKWRSGKCNFATHVKDASQKDTKVLNSIKASKRKAMGKL